MSNVRLRRLKADSVKLQDYVRRHPRVRLVHMDGDPPERYQLEYRINSVRMVGGELQPVQSHLVEVTLPRNYPRLPPQCRMLSPVFHPNIAPHAICVGDHWGAGESLESLIIRIGEMLAYQSYNVKSPLNGEAARWVEENKHRVPLDPVSLLPEEEPGTAADPSVADPSVAGLSGAGPPPYGSRNLTQPGSQTPATDGVGPTIAGLSEAGAPPFGSHNLAQAGSQTPVADTAAYVHVKCPQCGTAYRVAANIVGRNVRCKKCSEVFACAAGEMNI